MNIQFSTAIIESPKPNFTDLGFGNNHYCQITVIQLIYTIIFH